MSEGAARRFWSEVTVEDRPDGYAIRLDARLLKTPAKRDLLVPTAVMAQAVAAEWVAQEETIDPSTMPATRAANAALDRVAPQQGAVAEMLAEYAGTDLLCYRAAAPEKLAARQREQWDPLLDWAADAFGARLVPVAGLMPGPQSDAALEALAEQVRGTDAFRLTGFHVAVTHDRLTAPAAWETSRVDEEWQAEQWGRDEEADAMAATRRRAFLDAARFHALASGLG